MHVLQVAADLVVVSLELVEALQAGFDNRELLRVLLLASVQSSTVRQRGAESYRELLPMLDLALQLLLALLMLLLQQAHALTQRRQLGRQCLPSFFHLAQFGFLRRQRMHSGGDIQRLIGGNRRVLMGAAQRAGFAILQLSPQGFQLVNALLRFEQSFLIGNALFKFSIACALRLNLSRLAFLLDTHLVQQGGKARLLLQSLLPGALQLAQLLQQASLALQGLPMLAQLGFTAPIQQLVELLALLLLSELSVIQALLLGG